MIRNSRKLHSRSWSHLKNDVLLEDQGPFQLSPDRDKALHDLLDILVRLFACVCKGNDGTVNCPELPGRGRKRGSLVFAQCGRWREERKYAMRI